MWYEILVCGIKLWFFVGVFKVLVIVIVLVYVVVYQCLLKMLYCI